MGKNLHTRERRALTKALKRVRLKAGLKQAELAELLKKPQSFVSKYESGERRLDFLEIRSICLATSTKISEFNKLFDNMLEDEP
jgi:transcriptional regulator with XRE-family HTH domain